MTPHEPAPPRSALRILRRLRSPWLPGLALVTLAVAVAVVVAGCRAGPSPTAEPAPADISAAPAEPRPIGDLPPIRGELMLDRGWAPAALPDDSPAGSRARLVRFELDEGRVGAGSVLVLDDPWWSARVAVNGVEAGRVNGGVGPVGLPVGEHLRVGQNELVVVLEPPSAESAPALLTNGSRGEPTLGFTPLLSLRPASHVDAVALRTEGTDVRAVVRTHQAPAGARVRVSTTLDGALLQDLGQSEITAEVTSLPAVTWTGPRWSPVAEDDGALVHVVATLESAEGRVLDRLSRRTGVRSMTVGPDGFVLDGLGFAMLADRIRSGRSPHVQLPGVLDAGINALEAHGRWPSNLWLDEADELGLPVVLLPRCVGDIWAGAPGNREEQLTRWRDDLARQDGELVWAAATHPSIVLWACEGGPGTASQLCEGIHHADPVGTPVASVDLPSRSIGAVADGEETSPPAWIVEVGQSRRAHPISTTAEYFAQASGGTYGGVALSRPPEDGDLEEWQTAWIGVARQLGVPALSLSDRRAPARVRVEGLEPGRPAWVEVEGLTPVGALTGAGGSAEVDVWHRGTAGVVVGTDRWEVTLEPDRWRDLERISHAVLVSAAGP